MSTELLKLSYDWAKDITFIVVIMIVLSLFLKRGIRGVATAVIGVLMQVPGIKAVVLWYLRKELASFLQQIGLGGDRSSSVKSLVKALPEKGLTPDVLTELLRKYKAKEFNPHSGKGFAYVYTQEDEKFKVVEKAYNMFNEDNDTGSADEDKAAIVRMFLHSFMHENALNPMVFPSLRQFEVETVAMTAWMLNGPEGTVGSVTSGGTESILMAIKTYRDRARDLFPQIKSPEMVAPITIHPAFEKAAEYFDLKMVHVPVVNYRLDMAAYEKAITPNTILLLGSAPEYCYGIVDPLPEISRLAETRKLPLHVDACFGGFMLPWVERCGYSLPVFDFRLLGVTSISADVHKYGFGPKGASIILYRSADIRRYQIFTYSDWPGGLFGSPSMAGTRPGGNLASSWATMLLMGQNGYMGVAERLMKVTRRMTTKINEVEELIVCGSPDMTAFAFSSPTVNIYAIADQMEHKGWKIERAANCLHCTVLPSHTIEIADDFVADLKTCIQIIKDNPQLANKGSAGMYGMAVGLPARGLVKEFLIEFFNEVYTFSK